MTIGFGDFVPGKAYIYNIDEGIEETEANAKLVLGAIYILLGMGIIAMCVNLMQEKIITEVYWSKFYDGILYLVKFHNGIPDGGSFTCLLFKGRHQLWNGNWRPLHVRAL